MVENIKYMHRYDLYLHDNTRVFIYVAFYYKYFSFFFFGFLLFVFYSNQAFFILYLYFLLILTFSFMLNVSFFYNLMHQALCFNICVYKIFIIDDISIPIGGKCLCFYKVEETDEVC